MEDIVADLDRWLSQTEPTTPYAPPVIQPVLQRARDEIAWWRDGKYLRLSQGTVQAMLDKARTDALEEAAREVERFGALPMVINSTVYTRCAAAIRAMKDRQ